MNEQAYLKTIESYEAMIDSYKQTLQRQQTSYEASLQRQREQYEKRYEQALAAKQKDEERFYQLYPEYRCPF
jgi:hypothetical protein